MAILWTVVGILTGIIVVPMLIWAFVWYKSFIHKAWIAKQSGKDFGDVIWVEDRYKVKQKDGYHVIIFRNHFSKSQSFAGEFWTKWLKVPAKFVHYFVPSEKTENKELKFKHEEWKKQDMHKHIGRGLFLYQNAEGEFHPMSVTADTKDGKAAFKVLDQDNRAFIISGFDHTNNMSLTGRKQLIAVIAVIIGIVILGIAFVLFLVYMTESAANFCGTAGSNFVQTAQNAVGG